MFMTPLTEFEYYWEKAEFQDPVSHRAHVENYKKGIRDSIAFDEQYQKEAEEELKKENDLQKVTLKIKIFLKNAFNLKTMAWASQLTANDLI